jgi:hypothetical protein
MLADVRAMSFLAGPLVYVLLISQLKLANDGLWSNNQRRLKHCAQGVKKFNDSTF